MVPGNDVLSADVYNQMFTMHGTTMIFLAVMPMSAAFFNYMVPLHDRSARRGLPAAERVQLLGLLRRRP